MFTVNLYADDIETLKELFQNISCLRLIKDMY